MAATYKEYQCRSILRIHKYIDNWFWESASVSPYKACEHGCNYCDGRSQRYHASADFDDLIHVKINAEEILRKELDKFFPKQKTLSDFGMESTTTVGNSSFVVAVSSGISDAYQPAEKKYKLTQKILKLFLEHGIPTFVMTKSDLILRDLDLLKKISDKSWCNISFSLSTVDKKIAGIFEPRATSPENRLKAMNKISDEGILTGITYMPIIPYITDSKKQIDDTIRLSKEYGAKYALASSMTTRDLQAKRFYDTLNKHFPDLEKKHKALYKNGYQPSGKYLKGLYEKVNSLCVKYEMPRYIPRYIPRTKLMENIKTSTTLFLISYFLDLKGESHRSNGFRRSAMSIETMNENIRDLYKENDLGKVKGIQKGTMDVIMEILETGRSSYLEALQGF